MKHILPDVSTLPPPNDLKRKLQSLAMLDAILMPDWDLRYFSFNSKWGAGEMMSSMKDGEGSEFFFLFNADGVIGKINCKGSSLGANVNSLLAKIPCEFASFIKEPAFRIYAASCYLWWRVEDGLWSLAPKDIVGIPLLAFVADQGEYYHAWAQKYYDCKISLESVRAVFRHETLTDDLVVSLNSGIELEAALADCQEINY